jgi:hypothetical protein
VLDTIFGLPMHPLIVHATVVLVPTAALLVAVAAVYPRFRSWIGPVPALAALLACVLVPLSTGSGEELEGRVVETSLIEDHAELGETLLWLVLPLAAAAVIGYLLHRRAAAGRGAGKAVLATVAVASLVLSGATLVDVALIGHSGAKASWSNVTDAPAPADSGDDD